MKRYVKWKMECMERVHFFGEKPEIVLTPAETPLFASLTTKWTAMKSWAVEQEGGKRDYRGGSLDRRLDRDKVLTAMRESGKTLAQLTADLVMFPQVLLNVSVPRGFDWKKHPAIADARVRTHPTPARAARHVTFEPWFTPGDRIMGRQPFPRSRACRRNPRSARLHRPSSRRRFRCPCRKPSKPWCTEPCRLRWYTPGGRLPADT